MTGCSQITANTYNTTYVPETALRQVHRPDALDGAVHRGGWQGEPTRGTPELAALHDRPACADITMGVVATTASDGRRPPLMQWSPLTNATKYVVSVSVAGANCYSAATHRHQPPAYAYTGEDTSPGQRLSHQAPTTSSSRPTTAAGLTGELSVRQVQHRRIAAGHPDRRPSARPGSSAPCTTPPRSAGSRSATSGSTGSTSPPTPTSPTSSASGPPPSAR